MAEKEMKITIDDLKGLIQEIRKPVKSEKEVNDEKQAEEDRLRLRRVIKQKEANDKAEQDACPHIRNNGTTTCVYVYANGGPEDYLHCQHCHLNIFPSKNPEMWNRLHILTPEMQG